MNNVEIKKFVESKKFKKTLWGIGIFVVIILIFQAGMLVGYHKASFSYRFGEKYYQTFGGRPRGEMMNMMGGFGGGEKFPNAHGVLGKIIKIDLPTIILESSDNIEKVVLLKEDTAIRRFRDTLKPTDLKLGDMITSIGSPNANAEIEAKLIRILPFPNENATSTSTNR